MRISRASAGGSSRGEREREFISSIRPAVALLVAAGVLPGAATAAFAAEETIKGLRFVTIAKRNTFSGQDKAGVPFNIYFRQGGFVTYYSAKNELDHGRWRIDRQNRVCIKWQVYRPKETHCYRVVLSGRRVLWRGREGRYDTRLRGGITDTFLEPRPR